MTTEQSNAFGSLIASYQVLEPNIGWDCVGRVPALTDQNLAIVLAESLDLLADAMSDERVAREVVVALTLQCDEVNRLAALGRILHRYLTSEARRFVLRELRIDSGRQQIEGETRSAAAIAANDAGVPLQGPL